MNLQIKLKELIMIMTKWTQVYEIKISNSIYNAIPNNTVFKYKCF